MAKELLIDASRGQVTALVVEDGHATELLMSGQGGKRVTGSIFKGRVENAIKGMQAAFLNIGLEHNAMLHFDDAPIAAKLRGGQELLVQAVKEPTGQKGPRVTTKISLPGRAMVLIPTEGRISVSSRIQDADERVRLRGIFEELAESHREGDVVHGTVIRTAAAGLSAQELGAEFFSLVSRWKELSERAIMLPAPAILYDDDDVFLRVARDLISDDVASVTVSDEAAYASVRAAIKSSFPEALPRVRHLPCAGGLILMRGFRTQIDEALGRKIWLPSGGTLVIDQTEALTAIDVNTGKFTGSRSLTETALKVNREAAREIARQLRLRDVGGIIIIDFIDMDSDDARRAVLAELQTALSRDRTRSQVHGFTALGLVEMTRNRLRPSLCAQLQRECPVCGSGHVLTEDATARRALDDLDRMRSSADAPLRLTLHPNVARAVAELGDPGPNARIAPDPSKSFGRYSAEFDV